METTPPYTERRQHPRFEVQSLVVAAPSRPNTHIARVVNVSKGGMAVRYVEHDEWLGEASKIDIFVNSDFYMTGMPVETIRDFLVTDHASFRIISERQCSLQFKSLSPEQERTLDEFIIQHTPGNS
jgi:c-di-GMP-binding flagellar brake protein YcgR